MASATGSRAPAARILEAAEASSDRRPRASSARDPPGQRVHHRHRPPASVTMTASPMLARVTERRSCSAASADGGRGGRGLAGARFVDAVEQAVGERQSSITKTPLAAAIDSRRNGLLTRARGRARSGSRTRPRGRRTPRQPAEDHQRALRASARELQRDGGGEERGQDQRRVDGRVEHARARPLPRA